jgi:outer membrane protein OmpA-like peptidoglycan-associated protein
MPGIQRTTLVALLLLVSSAAFASAVDAQIFDRLKKRAQRAAESELLSEVDRLVRDGVGCLFDDLECIAAASEAGDDVYLTDADGNPVLDAEGRPVADPEEAARIVGQESPGGTLRPGEGAWARYDFVPGDEVLFVADYSRDAVGDFPRRFELVRGSFEVVEWQGDRYVRALSDGMLSIPLPEALPERFTLETTVNLQHGNARLRILPGGEGLTRARDYVGSAVTTRWRQTGVEAFGNGPETLTAHDQSVWDRVVPLRVMADGEYMKVYLGDERVANVPNAVFPRTDRLYVEVGSARPEHPILLGPIDIAAGGADLYDRLAADGRVATQGILFDVDSDRLRPESTPTLKAIGEMLQEHPDLRLTIEGHTDSDGDDAYNLDLSARRAEAVRGFLVEAYDIDGDRLASEGLGETMPAAPNTTPEGKRQNRRVELVRAS